MKTLIVIASLSELELAKKEIEERKLVQAGIVITGVGGLNILNALNEVDRNTHIINVGYAGSADIPVFTRVEVGECTLYHPNVTYKEPVYHTSITHRGTPCYTSNDFVLSTNKKGCVFDMELAYIFGMGFTNVESVKYVSDNCNYEEYVKHSGNQD